jgi:hypothetical protein
LIGHCKAPRLFGLPLAEWLCLACRVARVSFGKLDLAKSRTSGEHQ